MRHDLAMAVLALDGVINKRMPIVEAADDLGRRTSTPLPAGAWVEFSNERGRRRLRMSDAINILDCQYTVTGVDSVHLGVAGSTLVGNKSIGDRQVLAHAVWAIATSAGTIAVQVDQRTVRLRFGQCELVCRRRQDDRRTCET